MSAIGHQRTHMYIPHSSAAIRPEAHMPCRDCRNDVLFRIYILI